MVLPLALARAQPAPYVLDNFNTTDGLPENSVREIIQDHLGFIWIGTQNGLVRYDGLEMTLFTYDPDDLYSFKGYAAGSLSEDSNGDIWIGSRYAYLTRYERATGRFVDYAPPVTDPDDPLRRRDFGAEVHADRHGQVWVTSLDRDLRRLDPARGIWRTYRHSEADSTSISLDIVNWRHQLDAPFLEDSHGVIWVATPGGGLNRYNRSTDDWTRFTTAEFDHYAKIRSLLYSQVEGRSALASITEVGNDEDLTRTFTLEKRTPVLVIGEGEGVGGPMVDYGWIERAVGDTVWTMEASETHWAGGAIKNRLQIRTDTLPAGAYQLRYKSDDSHAFDAWNDRPPESPEWWGIQVFEAADFDIPATPSVDAVRASSSISSDYVYAVHEDKIGRLWVGTSEGLDLFDRKDETFTHYRPTGTDPGGMAVSAIFEDPSGLLWLELWPRDPFARSSSGLSLLDPTTGAFKSYPIDIGQTFERSLPIHVDERGQIWVVLSRGSLDRDRFVLLDRASGRLTDLPMSGPFYEEHLQDRSGVLWIGMMWGGLNRFDPHRRQFPHYEIPVGPEDSRAPQIEVAVEDEVGDVWIGSRGGGLTRFNRGENAVTPFRHDPSQQSSLSNDNVRAILPGEDHVLLIGTETGLDRMDITTERFRHFVPWPDKRGDPTYNEVTAIHEDGAGRLWLVTGRGLVKFDRVSERFTHYQHDPMNTISLRGWPEARLLEDRRGMLWLSAHGNGVYRFDPQTERFIHFPAWRPEDPDRVTVNSPRLSEGRVLRWLEDRAGVLWIQTDGGGINRFDEDSGTFTAYGLEPSPLFSGVGMIEDSTGRFWVSTMSDGLYLFDRTRGVGRPTGVDVGQPLLDHAGKLWGPGGKGLTRFDPDTEESRTYTTYEGLEQSLEPLLVTRDGTLFFKTETGFHVFHPNDLIDNRFPPQVTLTSLRLSNQEIKGGKDSPLSEDISAAEEISLRHDQNDLAIGYQGLHFSRTERIVYAYRLEPYQQDWVEVGSERFARYPNLKPGEYVFRVKAANADGVWSDGGTSIRIVVNPPWWRTVWAYGVYILFFIAGAFGVVRDQRRRVARRERDQALERELERAKQIEAAHENLKSAYGRLQATQSQLVQSEKMASLGQLTAGIAHEIKNPLNFVTNFSELSEEVTEEIEEELASYRDDLPDVFVRQVEDVLASLKENSAQINEHGKRADSIVKSMLQHARTGTGEREPVDLNRLLDEHINLAWHGAQARHPGFDVTIERDFDTSVRETRVIPQEIGRVVVNLLNNAFDALRDHLANNGTDFVPHVRVSSHRTADAIEIRVSDNGPGIPANVRDKIFEPFFTTKPTGSGTGLGLSMSYDIVTKGHGGTLDVISGVGRGATFVVRLPV